jgi:hypothetical protein
MWDKLPLMKFFGRLNGMEEAQAEQTLFGRMHQKEIMVNITQGESIKIEVVPDKSSNNNNSSQLFSRINDSDLFALLPIEVLLKILEYLTLHKLYNLKLICKSWRQTIESLPNVESFRTYQLALRGSELWGYLPNIINNEPILTFIQGRLFPFQLSKNKQQELDTITHFCDHVFNTLILKSYEFSYRKKITPEYINQQIQFILQTVNRFDQSKTKNQESHFNFLWKHNDILMAVFKAYFDLEGILTAMILTTQLWSARGDIAHILCDSTTNRWLRGEDLIFLSIHSFYLLYEMVKQSICLHAYFQGTEHLIDPVLHDKYQQRSIALDTLLRRLTLPEWLQFLELDELDELHYRTAMVAEALETEHSVVPPELNPIISLKLKSIKKERIPPKILKQSRIKSVLHSIHFDGDPQPDDESTEQNPLHQQAYKDLEALSVQLEASRKQNQEIEAYLNDLNESQMATQERLEVVRNNQGPEIWGAAQNSLQPETFSSQPLLLSIPKQPIAGEEYVVPAAFNWRLALKIGASILLAFIGIGLILTGVGSAIGFPLLISLGLPLMAKFLLLVGGAISLLTSIVVGICTCCLARKNRENEPLGAVELLPDESPSNNLVKGHTVGMIQTFNKVPTLSNAQQKEISSFGKTHPIPYYPSPLDPGRLRNERPQEIRSQSHVSTPEIVLNVSV